MDIDIILTIIWLVAIIAVIAVTVSKKSKGVLYVCGDELFMESHIPVDEIRQSRTITLKVIEITEKGNPR